MALNWPSAFSQPNISSCSGEAEAWRWCLRSGVLFGVQPWNFLEHQLLRGLPAPNPMMAGNVVMVK